MVVRCATDAWKEDMQDLRILEPTSVDEATQLLAEHAYEAKILSGGTAVVLMYQQGLIRPRYLVSLSKVPHMDFIRYEPGIGLTLGALTTHHTVEMSPVVQTNVPVLADAFHQVANIRVRNQATVGGVLAEADYASDPPAALVALDAQVRVVGNRGQRTIAAKDFIQGFYQTALGTDEIITEVFIPELPDNARGAYLKYVSRSSEDRPCVGVAALVKRENGNCEGLQIVVGAVAGKPQNFPDIDEIAEGQRLTDSLVREIARRYAERIEPLSDIRGSGWYRKQVIEVLIRRAIEQTGTGND